MVVSRLRAHDAGTRRSPTRPYRTYDTPFELAGASRRQDTQLGGTLSQSLDKDPLLSQCTRHQSSTSRLLAGVCPTSHSCSFPLTTRTSIIPRFLLIRYLALTFLARLMRNGFIRGSLLW